ncbi:pilus assembly protein TadG-related protein [Sulfitobacter sp. D35]|uniref:pilus assembly protein TadG-related protein n=1 Tax=Sulfitobacter sp. D35 TaxID=3083252 RepID=UPI00296EE30B|nr:pilus assembly protein TadG-related protein [Sulfitobacter sp. D35]MDW4499971.1 pilus assembly protein TadG-related protein [Sulfitobacter sp. D35]
MRTGASPLTAFWRDEHGGILVFAAMALGVMLGMVALVFDAGRLSATHTELQSFADGVALAAAGELDGAADALDRANLAAANLVSGSQTFAEGSATLAGNVDATVVYLDDLPADDTASTAAFQTNDPARAIYAHVTLTPRSVRLPFADALAALTGNAAVDNSIGAEAVAGFTRYACDITPLMFCLPNASYTADANIGDSILLRSGGNGAAWGPGDFGFLDVTGAQIDPEGPCAGLNGAQLTACAIAASGNISACFAQRGVDIEPGQKVGIENSIFNTRFDMFSAMMSGKKNNPAYAPGPHVVKGLKNKSGNGQCVGNNSEPTGDTMAFPEDDCFPTCANGRFGDGTWTAGRQSYVDTNYDGTDPFAGAPGVVTRYDYYRAEIAAAGPGGQILAPSKSESGRPQCSNSVINDPDRRVFVAAGIDCAANPINGAKTDVPVREFFRVFLLRPVGHAATSPPNFDLWVENIGSAGGNGAGASSISGVFRDVVQLYR